MNIPFDIAGSIEIEGLPARGIEVLRRAFSLVNPKWRSAIAMGLTAVAADLPETIEYIREMPTGKLHVPRGGILIASELLHREGMILEERDDRRENGSLVAIPLVGVSLRDYQTVGVQELGHGWRGADFPRQGVIVLPPGCGKTRLGVGAIASIGRTTLVMAPTLELLQQWEEQILVHLHVSAGVLSAGREEDDRDIVIGTEASIYNKLLRDPEWGKRFGFFIVDEAHRAVCSTIQACLDKIPARCRLALTATPNRDDGQGKAIDWTFGPRLLERTVPEMVKLGYLMQVTVERDETFYLGIGDPSGWKDSGKYRAKLEEDLCDNDHRNEKIVLRAQNEARKGHTILILTGRKTHVTKLVKLLRHQGVDAEGLTSASAWAKRKDVVESFRAGKLPVLVATSLADQGLDIPRLSRVLLAFPYRSKTMTAQRSGRVMRVFELKKDAIVVDFVDCNVPVLDSRAKDRKRLYKTMGLTIVE